MISALQAGDYSGLAALALIAASSLSMVYRKRVLTGGVSLRAVRWAHLSLSAGAAAALAVHISLMVGFAQSLGVLLGYAAFAAALLVWLTGSAFAERMRDSLVFHGQLTIVMIALVLAHASAASVALSGFAPFVLTSVAVVALLNGAYHLSKLREAMR